MPNFLTIPARPYIPRAIRIVSGTAACGLLVLLTSACGFTPTPGPPAANTPPASTSEPTREGATPTLAPGATDTAEAVPSTATAIPPPTSTSTETSTATPSPTETEVPIPSFAWKEVGLGKAYLRDMALLPGGNNVVLAASSDGLWRSSYDYTNWEKLAAPASGNPPPGNAEVSIAPDTIYLARHTGCSSGLKMVSYRSTDGGKRWPTMNIEITSVYAANATVAYATTCGGVVKSTDAGATWSNELPGSKFENSDAYSVVSSPDAEMVYVASASEGGTGHIKKSTDGGATWQDITPSNAPDGQLQSVVYLQFIAGSEGRPQDGGLYMANTQGTWFQSAESNDWQLKPSGAAPSEYYVTAFHVDAVYSADYDKPGPVLYEARAQFGEQGPAGLGVFRSTNGGASWQRMGDDLGKRMVTGLVVAPHDTAAGAGMVETLLASTSDGMWAVSMPPPFK